MTMMDTMMSTVMKTKTTKTIKANVELANSLGLPIQLAALVSEEEIMDYKGLQNSSLNVILVAIKHPWLISTLEKLSGKDRETLVTFVNDHSGDWETLKGKKLTERTVLAAVLGCTPKQYNDSPWWMQHFKRANPYRGNWVANFSSDRYFNFDSLSDEELDFVVATDGLLPLHFLSEKDQILVVMEHSDNWKTDASIIVAGGLSALDGKNMFDGLEEFYPMKLLLKIKNDGSLGLLPKVKPNPDALILQENFWSQCDFTSFSELPSYFFSRWDGYIPKGFTYTAENCGELKPLTSSEFEYCTQMNTLEVPEWLPESLQYSETCNVVFCELEGKRILFENQFGKENADILIRYNYGWDTNSVEFKDVVLSYHLTRPVEESAGEVIALCFEKYPKICSDGFHGDWHFIMSLAQSGMLKQIKDFYRKVFYDKEAATVAKRISAYLNGEQYWTSTSLLLQNACAEEHLDLLTAVKIASECEKEEYSDVWFLNLLDGNRVLSEDETCVGIRLNKDDGSIITYFGGEKAEDVILGITGAPYQIIDVGGEYKAYHGVCIDNL